MNIRKRSRSAFTLLEMLMVIIIIFMLSLLVFRLMDMVDNRANVAKTVYVLKQVQNALNEYKLEYGIYPPVHIVEYEYFMNTNGSAWFQTFLGQHDDPDDTVAGSPRCFWADRGDDEAGDEGARIPGQYLWTGDPGYPAKWNLKYKYGLVAHLDYRDRGQVHPYDEDTSRDIAAKKKWEYFMKGLVGYKLGPKHKADYLGTKARWTNMVGTISDGFGKAIKYECHPPYTSYKLWSDSAGTIDSGSIGGI